MSIPPLTADPNRWVRAPEIQHHFGLSTGYSATLWRWVRDGKLPQPQYLNGKRVWRAGDILEAEKNLLARGNA
jgi:predicted DNA-binding transcriptional regulator AlpA